MCYCKLTKKLKNEQGQECIACAFYGTDRCQIHNGYVDCGSCPVLGLILRQLHTYEEVLEEVILSGAESEEENS